MSLGMQACCSQLQTLLRLVLFQVHRGQSAARSAPGRLLGMRTQRREASPACLGTQDRQRIYALRSQAARMMQALRGCINSAAGLVEPADTRPGLPAQAHRPGIRSGRHNKHSGLSDAVAPSRSEWHPLALRHVKQAAELPKLMHSRLGRPLRHVCHAGCAPKLQQ